MKNDSRERLTFLGVNMETFHPEDTIATTDENIVADTEIEDEWCILSVQDILV